MYRDAGQLVLARPRPARRRGRARPRRPRTKPPRCLPQGGPCQPCPLPPCHRRAPPPRRSFAGSRGVGGPTVLSRYWGPLESSGPVFVRSWNGDSRARQPLSRGKRSWPNLEQWCGCLHRIGSRNRFGRAPGTHHRRSARLDESLAPLVEPPPMELIWSEDGGRR